MPLYAKTYYDSINLITNESVIGRIVHILIGLPTFNQEYSPFKLAFKYLFKLSEFGFFINLFN